MAKTRFKGRDRLKRKLQALPDIVVLAVRQGLAEAAREVTEMMKRLVAVADGDLRDSIQWRYGDVEREKYAQGSRATGRLAVRVTAGNSRVRYAHLVEFGAAAHTAGGIFAGARHPGAPAQPFFYPSYRASKRKAVSRIRRSMKLAAKRAASS